MNRKWRGAIKLGSEAPRQSWPEGKAGRETKDTFRQAGECALAMLAEIRKKKGR